MGQISTEGTLGLLLGFTGLGGAGALFVLPHPYADYVGWSLIAIAVLGGVTLGYYHFGNWMERKGSIFFIAVFVCGIAFDGWFFWDSSRFLPPPPPPPPPGRHEEPPKPPHIPWVTQDEIEAQQKLGRILLNYSPEELLGMWASGKNIGAYFNKWIKIDYLLRELILDTVDKKQVYVAKMIGRSSWMWGYVFAYFDPKKWEARLMQLHTDVDRVKAICQFDRIDRLKEPQSGLLYDKLIADHCDLL